MRITPSICADIVTTFDCLHHSYYLLCAVALPNASGKGLRDDRHDCAEVEPAVCSRLSGHGRVVWTDCQAGPLGKFVQEGKRRRSPRPAWGRKARLSSR